MSGIRTTMSTVVYRTDHVAAAHAVGQDPASIHSAIMLHCIELLRHLNLQLATMQTGDPNIATVTAQIAALS